MFIFSYNLNYVQDAHKKEADVPLSMVYFLKLQISFIFCDALEFLSIFGT